MSSKQEIVWSEVARLYLLRRVTKPLKKLYLISAPSASDVGVSSASSEKTQDEPKYSTTMTLSIGRGEGVAFRTTIWNWYSKAGRGVFLSFQELSELYTAIWMYLDGQEITVLDFEFDDNRSMKIKFDDDRLTVKQKRGDVESQVELGREEMGKVIENIPAFQLCRDIKIEPDVEHFKKIGEIFAGQATIEEIRRVMESDSIFSATTGTLVKRVLAEQLEDIKLNFGTLIKALRESIGLKQAEVREIKNAGMLLLSEDGEFPVVDMIKRLDDGGDLSTLEKVSRTLFYLMKDSHRRREFGMKRQPKEKPHGKRQKNSDKN